MRLYLIRSVSSHRLTAATMAGVVNKFFITSLVMWAAPIAILYAFNHNLIPDLALWRRFVSRKYGLQNNWITDEVTGVFGCCVWKTIRRLWPSFASNISLKIGDGVKTDFWNEIWIGDRDLKTLFQIYLF
ncbi:hypothetical protein H5410_057819 [Solanum commersonii]|uniref:Uncharacterized protein n=1 Tax=Solanum commersonii TaxID=4109 RepID=A0A9J5WQU2_SOLCO|nr:hypothetical protein H5410_057819 [Solanum commersonii]